MAFIGIDPGNVESAYVVVADDLSEVLEKGKVENLELMRLLTRFKLTYDIRYVAIEMIASYGMPVGASVFDTCVWIGRFKEHCLKLLWEVEFVYRKEEKMLLCNSMKAKDSNIRQALVDRFAKDTPNKGKGTKKLDNRNQVKIKKISMIFHGFYCTLKIPEEKALFFRVV